MKESLATSESVQSVKYLTFGLGGESYGVPVCEVREIIRMMEIVPIPELPPYLKGVVNLRGRTIPIIDLRMRFGLRNCDVTERTCIIVMQIEGKEGHFSQMGVIVDAVEEVVFINMKDIEDSPQFGCKMKTDYLAGLAKVKDQVKILIRMKQIIEASEVENLMVAA